MYANTVVGIIEQLFDALRKGELLGVREFPFVNLSDLLSDQDARISHGGEQIRVSEIQYDAWMCRIEKVRPESFSVRSTHVLVAGYETKDAVLAEELE